MNILVVGNGSIGVDKANGKYYVNHHTGNFLLNLQKDHQVCFVQNGSVYDKDSNLLDFDLLQHDIKFQIVDSYRSISMIIKIFFRADFVYLFYPGTLSRVFGILSVLSLVPYGLYVRGQYYNRSLLDKIVLSFSSFILTVSPLIASDVRRYCKQSDIIKPMISISELDINRARKHLYISPLKLLFVGRVEARKGIYDLIEIAKLLKEKAFQFKLEIVGGGDLIKEIQKLIRSLDLAAQIEIHGLISDSERLREIYDSADVFVFTSHDEGFPRVLYEAMASGLPIFTTFVGGIAGRMVDGINCRRIYEHDPKKSSDILYRSLTNNIELQKIADGGVSTLTNMLRGDLKSHEELLIELLKNEKKTI
jgi:glycosyltransferase involved in cell wall biosynthesis